MNEIALLFAAFFGATAIILGAFGAHLLKKKLSIEQLKSFETGVKYQIYHAIAVQHSALSFLLVQISPHLGRVVQHHLATGNPRLHPHRVVRRG